MPAGATSAIAAWKLPPIVAALVVSIVAGFYLGGPGLGMAVGGLAATAVIAMAVRKPPAYPIEPPLPAAFRRHILVVLAAPIDESTRLDSLLRRLAPAAAAPAPQPAIRLLAPARHGRAARWTSDLEPGRERAARALVLGVALLAKAGFVANARVGDEGVVQSVEDELRTFPATEVLLLSAPSQGLRKAADELEARLTIPLRLCGPVGGEDRAGGRGDPDGAPEERVAPRGVSVDRRLLRRRQALAPSRGRARRQAAVPPRGVCDREAPGGRSS
jgi:hypothetical protein